MKKILLMIACFCFLSPLFGDDSILGFWKTINEDTGKAESIVAVYEYQGKYYGRIVATYGDNGKIAETLDNPKERAPGVVGNPPYVGMDIIWDLQKDGDTYNDGSILDPEHGKVYNVELWNENGNLIVRGKLLFFGRNQTWLPVNDPDFKKPDVASFTPNIPQVK